MCVSRLREIYGHKIEYHRSIDPSFIYVRFPRCVLLADKGKLEMTRNKFLDCGEMLILGGQARSSLEDNHPCARMVPLIMLDEETDLPEMKGPNTYRCLTEKDEL